MMSASRAFLARLTIFAALLVAPGSVGAFDLQGHRGARGLSPENTLAAFAQALMIGVTTLETDLAVTKDNVLVLSHDPALNPDIVRGPDGQWIAPPGAAINSLTLGELRRFDVGRLKPDTWYAKQFPQQRAIDGQRIPTLAELFALAETSGKMPRFNIETKLAPDKPEQTPEAETFARLVVDAIRQTGVAARTTVQSFDWRTLLIVRRLAPEIETVCLTSPSTLRDANDGGSRHPSPWLGGLDLAAHAGSVPRLTKTAGCGTWSPAFAELGADQIREAHVLGLKVVPWTVNAPETMAELIDMKVDGLITDYPDRAREVMAVKGIDLP
jgi:glycerophosphoryl diester phosphodiesterase